MRLHHINSLEDVCFGGNVDISSGERCAGEPGETGVGSFSRGTKGSVRIRHG